MIVLVLLFARVWILDDGLPDYVGFTYTRAWGLLVALQVAGPPGVVISAGFLGERIIADRRKFFAPPPSDGPADAGDEHPPVQSDATSEVER